MFKTIMLVVRTIARFYSSACQFKPVSHVIFDIDGLLLRTEDIYYKADATMIAKYGKEYTWDLRMKVLGCTEQMSVHKIVSELKLPISEERYRTEVKELLREMLPKATLMPGAEKLVRHLSASKVPIAVATSSGLESVELKTTNHKELFKLFHHIVAASSDPTVKHGKPSPDVFLACASRFADKPDPTSCLVFEDAPNGVTAALNAKMQVVLVPEDYVSEEDRKRATCVVKSLLEFRPESFGLPPFSN